MGPAMRGSGLKGSLTERAISTTIMETSMMEIGRIINAMDMESIGTKKVRCIKVIGTTISKKVTAKKFGQQVQSMREHTIKE
jgi:hypothetical protein